MDPHKSTPPNDDDAVLKELAAKAAELAEHYSNKNQPAQKSTTPKQHTPTHTSHTPSHTTSTTDPAVAIIRSKLDRIFTNEPDTEVEIEEVSHPGIHRSAHQEFMYQLTTSGASLADIQTKWHEYYVALPNEEKHQVWQEFYQAQNETGYSLNPQLRTPSSTATAESKDDVTHAPDADTHREVHTPSENVTMEPNRLLDASEEKLLTAHASPSNVELASSPATKPSMTVRDKITHNVSAGGKITPAQHFKSLLFGLGLAAFVGLLLSFTFFNQYIIAPFISPSKTVSATPIIGEVNGPVGPEAKIIIPKINLEVPVVFGLDTIAEDAIQTALEDGVVHYATTPNPGEIGNSVIVGHSSNNILNSGKYKFAFVLLSRLENDDVFYVHKDGVRYTYKIYEKKIVPPTDVSVLGDAARANSITLITCDPPGTSINRLIIVAEQISPDPVNNTAATPTAVVPAEDTQLPSNAPSLWSRIIGIF